MKRIRGVAAAAKEVMRINPRFTLEAHAKTLPYKNKADIEREVAALRKAGYKKEICSWPNGKPRSWS